MTHFADEPESLPDEAFQGPEWVGRYALSGGGPRRRMSDGRRRKRRLQRRTGLILLGLGALMIVTAAWVVITALMARGELYAMKRELTSLRQDVSSGNLPDARVVADELSRHASRAHALTTGPAWFVSAGIPGVGDPLAAARGIATAADSLGASTVPKLIDISNAVDPSNFTFANHTLDINPLVKQTPTLDAAVQAADAQRQLISTLPTHTWLSAVNSGVSQVSSELTKLTGTLDSVDQAAHAAPLMLGYTAPQRYFVGFQNEAEARGTGGLPGAFGIVVADHGKLTFTHFGSDSELEGVDSGLDLGAAYNAQWHDYEPTKQYLNSTVSPNFPDAAKIWAAMWQKKSGEHVDGALSLDPTALSYFLAVTGAATLPDKSQVSSANVVALTQSTVYAKFATDNNARKAYLLQVAQAIDQRVLGGGGSTTALFKAAAKAAGERRLLVWDADPTVEAALSRGTIAGAIPQSTAPLVEPVLINYAENKLDYYLDEGVQWRASGCGTTQNVAVTITLTNNAPSDGLSSYVMQRMDDPPYAVKPGDNRLMLYYVGTQGGRITSATINGTTVGTTNEQVDGHPSYSMLVEAPRSKPTVVVLHLEEPRSGALPDFVSQPRVHGADVSVAQEGCK